MNNDICTVEKCKSFRQGGDLLFCLTHRFNWRGFCKINGIEEIDILPSETYLLLDVFCGKITKAEYYQKLGYKISQDAS